MSCATMYYALYSKNVFTNSKLISFANFCTFLVFKFCFSTSMPPCKVKNSCFPHSILDFAVALYQINYACRLYSKTRQIIVKIILHFYTNLPIFIKVAFKNKYILVSFKEKTVKLGKFA